MTVKYRRKFIVPSTSQIGREYLVAITEYGEWQCSCPVWIYRRRECKHIHLAKHNPEKYEVETWHTTDQLGLNPTRRDDKERIPKTPKSSKIDNPSVR